MKRLIVLLGMSCVLLIGCAPPSLSTSYVKQFEWYVDLTEQTGMNGVVTFDERYMTFHYDIPADAYDVTASMESQLLAGLSSAIIESQKHQWKYELEDDIVTLTNEKKQEVAYGVKMDEKGVIMAQPMKDGEVEKYKDPLELVPNEL